MGKSMLELMYEYYRSQPTCMKGILERRDALSKPFGEDYRAHRPDRVYLIGSGSSFNACIAARAYLEHILSVEVTVAPPTALPVIRGVNPMALVISQSGKSTNTLASIDRLRKSGCRIVTFTAGTDVPVAKAADLAVDLGVGDENVGPKTSGYTGTVMSLYLAGLSAAYECGLVPEGEYGAEIKKLEGTVANLEENFTRCQTFFDTYSADLAKATQFVFVGKGTSAAVGEEAALKLLETICYPSAAYEFEEYLHGPGCCTAETSALFQFYVTDDDGPRMQKLAGITAKATPNSYLIDRSGTLGGERVLSLTSNGDPYHSPFEDILLGQLVSIKLTAQLGRSRHDAVKEIFADMDTKVVQVPPPKTR